MKTICKKPGFFSLLFYAILILNHGCSKREAIVAKFGKHTITLNEFRMAYLEVIKQPGMFDSKALRENFLNEMVARRLMAEEARKLGMDEDEKLRYRIEAYRNKCLRDIHYQKIIKPEIKIDTTDLKDAYAFSQEQRHVKHLFAKTKEKADSLYRLLEQGWDFDNLARRVFWDTALANSGGDLGWVYWDQLEYDLSTAVFKQPVNVYSKPIRSQFGYHIVKVIDYKINPLLSEYDYRTHQRKTKILLEYKIGETIAQHYVEKRVNEAKVQVYPIPLKFVGQKLAQILKRKPNPLNQMSVAQLREEEINALELGLWDIRNEHLVIVNGDKLTVGEFISSLNYIPYQAVYQSYKTALDFVIRDFILTREARDFGFAKSGELRQKVRLFEENLLQSKFREKLIRDITVSENEIRDYFNQRVASKNNDVKYEDFHDFINDTIRSNKKRQVIPDYVNRVSKEMKITKHMDVIHTYYDGILGKKKPQ